MDKNRTSTVPIVPKQYRLPFFMLVSCFALWGLLNNMTDNLVPAFSKIFMINASESAGVQISFYGAYAVLAIFASILLEEFSYKAGVLIGLGFYMIGALCYIPGDERTPPELRPGLQPNRLPDGHLPGQILHPGAFE